MIKLYKFEANNDVAVAVNGNKRQTFEKGATIVVTRDEFTSLLRLGFTLVGETEATYDDLATLFPKTKKEAKKDKKAEKEETKEEVKDEKAEKAE